MRPWGWVIIALALAVIVTGVASGMGPSDSMSGVTIELPSDQEDSLRDTAADKFSEYGLSVPDHVMLFYTESGMYLLLTDVEPETGEATVEGEVITSDDLDGDRGLIIADRVTITSEPSQTATAGEIRDSPGEYHAELVRLEGSYSQAVFALSAEDMDTTSQYAVGSLPGSVFASVPQGRLARWATIDLSKNHEDLPLLPEVFLRLGWVEDSLGLLDQDGTRFWINSETTVDAAVVEQDSSTFLFIAGTDVHAEPIDDVHEISDRGEELVGETVTVETNAVGTRTSTKQALLAVAQCAPESVAAPGVSCLPLVTDSTVHTGFAFDSTPTNRADAVVYVGLSNTKQSQVTVPESGKYELTGEVVATSRIDPRLPEGYGLIVYERERISDLSADAGDASAWVDSLTEQMKEQVTAGPDDWDEIRAEADSSTEDPTETGNKTEGKNGDTDETGDSDGSASEPGEPADLEIVRSEIGMNPIEVDQGTVVTVEITNHGEQAGEISLAVRFGNEFRDRTVEVPGESTKVVTFEYYPEEAGEVPVTVNAEDVGVIQVDGEESGLSAPGQPGFTLLTPLFGFLAVLILGRWRG